ncbi:hypothetical protein ABFG93_10355 [Pseudalkalibacillus hwajinpoensis]
MNKMDAIVEKVFEGIYRDMPELLDKYGETGRVKCREDNYHHIESFSTYF